MPDLIRTWIADRYVTLGTDGFGRSDTRAALREYFEVDRDAIALAALAALHEGGGVDDATMRHVQKRFAGNPDAPPWAR